MKWILIYWIILEGGMSGGRYENPVDYPSLKNCEKAGKIFQTQMPEILSKSISQSTPIKVKYICVKK